MTRPVLHSFQWQLKLSVGFGIESDIFDQSERANPIPKESAPGTLWKLSSSRPITARYIKRTSPSDTEFNLSIFEVLSGDDHNSE